MIQTFQTNTLYYKRPHEGRSRREVQGPPVNEIQGLYAVQTLTIGGHIAQIGTCIKQGMDNDGSTADNMLKMVDLGFRAKTPLQSCLDTVRVVKELTEHDEVVFNIVSLIYITPNHCHTILRMRTPGNLFEYHLVNLHEKKRLVCQDVYALFRLLHRIYMYESNSPVTDHQGNPRNNQGIRNRSLLFRITGKRRSYTISDLYATEIYGPISLPGFVDEFDEPEIEDTDDSDTSSDSSSGDNRGNNGDDDMQDPADTGVMMTICSQPQ